MYEFLLLTRDAMSYFYLVCFASLHRIPQKVKMSSKEYNRRKKLQQHIKIVSK